MINFYLRLHLHSLSSLKLSCPVGFPMVWGSSVFHRSKANLVGMGGWVSMIFKPFFPSFLGHFLWVQPLDLYCTPLLVLVPERRFAVYPILYKHINHNHWKIELFHKFLLLVRIVGASRPSSRWRLSICCCCCWTIPVLLYFINLSTGARRWLSAFSITIITDLFGWLIVCWFLFLVLSFIFVLLTTNFWRKVFRFVFANIMQKIMWMLVLCTWRQKFSDFFTFKWKRASFVLLKTNWKPYWLLFQTTFRLIGVYRCYKICFGFRRMKWVYVLLNFQSF